jgi:hypothetical protein
VANDAKHALSFFIDRLQRKCCESYYKIVICDFNLEGLNKLSNNIKNLTLVKQQQLNVSS